MDEQSANLIRISDYLPILHRRRAVFATVFLMVVAATTAVILLMPKVFQSKTKILVLSPDRPNMISTSSSALAGISGMMQTSPLDAQAEMLLSRPVLQKTMRDLKIPGKVRDFQDRIKLERDAAAQMLTLQADAETPERAAEIANSLANNYLDLSREQARSGSQVTVNGLDSQVDIARRKMEKAQNEYTDYLKKNNALIATTGASAIISGLLDMENSVRQAQATYSAAGQTLAELEKRARNVGPEVRAEQMLKTSPIAESLQQKLFDLNAELVGKQEEYLEDSEPIQTLKKRIAETQGQLKTVMASAVKPDAGLFVGSQSFQPNPLWLDLRKGIVDARVQQVNAEGKLRALLKSQTDLQRRADAIPDISARVAYYSQQRDLNTQNWLALLQKRTEMQIQAETVPPRAWILENAVPPDRQAKPRPVLYSVIGILLGLLIGTLAAILFDSRDPRAQSPEVVARSLQAPVVGAIPAAREALAPAQLDAQSAVGQHYRSVWLQLAYRGVGSRIRILGVTSARDGEGKTLTAANLAVVGAQTGKRVALVDLNLSDPQLAALFGVEDATGLRELLATGKPASEYLRNGVVPGLNVLPAGKSADGALVPLGERQLMDRLPDLLQEIGQEVDVVIVDLPATLTSTEVARAGEFVDGLLVVAGDTATKDDLHRMATMLETAGVAVVGAVCNRAKTGAAGVMA